MTASRVTDGLTRIDPREKSDRKEILAKDIEAAGEALRKLLNSGLNRYAIVTLVAQETKVPKRSIERVIDSLSNLHRTYCS